MMGRPCRRLERPVILMVATCAHSAKGPNASQGCHLLGHASILRHAHDEWPCPFDPAGLRLSSRSALRHARQTPRIRFLSIGPRVRSTLPSELVRWVLQCRHLRSCAPQGHSSAVSFGPGSPGPGPAGAPRSRTRPQPRTRPFLKAAKDAMLSRLSPLAALWSLDGGVREVSVARVVWPSTSAAPHRRCGQPRGATAALLLS